MSARRSRGDVAALVLSLILALPSGCGGVAPERAIEAVACPADIPEWAAGTQYAVGAFVHYDKQTYRCLQAHTAQANWTPNAVPALWELLDCIAGGDQPDLAMSGGGGGGGGAGGGGGGGGTHADCAALIAAAGAQSKWIHAGPDGKLQYQTLPRGDRIIDFSHAGYEGGGVAIPTATVQRTVHASGGDDTAAIQAALDAVAALPLGSGGLRGAVLLAPGTFHLDANATLGISASGVVLRGSGSGAGGTTLLLSGTPRQFLTVRGSGSWRRTGKAATITDDYVPSGASTVHVDSSAGLTAGERVLVDRPVTQEWISFMGMDKLVLNGKPQTWIKAGARIAHDRIITRVDGNAVTFDAPLSDSFDSKYVQPGATVTAYTFDGRITQVGVEHLRVVAPALDPQPKISEPFFSFATIDAVEDGWMRDVEFQDFTNGVQTGGTAKRVTIEDLHVVHTVAEQSPQPADVFLGGQQILVQRGSSGGTNIHFLVTSSMTPGPNVFLKFTATGNKGVDSAPHMRWATGALFDQVNTPGAGIEIQNRGNYGSGHGWSAGFSVLWNCVASKIIVQQPPGSQNWSIGCTGKEATAAPPGDTTIMPQGAIDSPGVAVTPSSLYLAQLCERLGQGALTNIGY